MTTRKRTTSATAQTVHTSMRRNLSLPDSLALPLSKRQREVLDYLVQHVIENGCPPTMREIGGYLGIVSTNAVAEHIDALERKGYIRRSAVGKTKARALRLVAEKLIANGLGDEIGGALRLELDAAGAAVKAAVGRLPSHWRAIVLLAALREGHDDAEE